jgi:hypothetical protein
MFAPSPYIQVACSEGNEIAVLDSAGGLHIFDARVTDRTSRTSLGSLASFFVHDFVGVGLAHFPTTYSSSDSTTKWITWGLDSPNSDAVVKVWTAESDDLTAVASGSADDDYWFEGSPGQNGSTPQLSPRNQQQQAYRFVTACRTSNLACARVCPSPVENSFLTVGFGLAQTETGRGSDWRADLWKLTRDETVEKVVSFQAGTDEFLFARKHNVLSESAAPLDELRPLSIQKSDSQPFAIPRTGDDSEYDVSGEFSSFPGDAADPFSCCCPTDIRATRMRGGGGA